MEIWCLGYCWAKVSCFLASQLEMVPISSSLSILTLLSMTKIFWSFLSSPLTSQSSCFSCILARQSRGMESSPSRDRFFILSAQVSGGQRIQTTPYRSTMSFICTKWSQKCRQIECQAQSSSWLSRIMLAKMQRSESKDRSEMRMPSPVSWLYSRHLFSRVMKAQIWKVKPQRLGSWQYMPRRLMFLCSPTFCHSLSGQSRMVSCGKDQRMMFRMVDLPLPMLPSMEMKRGWLCFGGIPLIKICNKWQGRPCKAAPIFI